MKLSPLFIMRALVAGSLALALSGFSMGAMTLLAYATRHPDRLLSAVIGECPDAAIDVPANEVVSDFEGARL